MLTVALAGGTGYWLRRQGVPVEQAKVVLGVLGVMAFFFAVLGFSCAVVSFFGHGGERSPGWITLGVLGFLLNGGLLGAGVMKGLGTVNARALSDVRAAMREHNTQVRAEYEQTGSLNYDSNRVSHVLQTLDKAAGAADGEAGRMAQVMRDFFNDMSLHAGRHKARADQLLQVNPLDPLALKTKADLQMRRSLVAALARSNEEFSAFLETAPAALSERLDQAGVGDAGQAGILSGFLKNYEVMREVRKCDQRMVEAMQAVLTLHEQNWQQWRVDEQGAFAGYQDAAATAEFVRLTHVIEAAGSEQSELQGRVVKDL